MKLGERLLNLRKTIHLSQEEVAEKLNVTRQTVSKWETDQSTPDFDKIAPLCKLYGITSDELLTGERIEIETEEEKINHEIEKNKIKRAKGIGISILLYFISVIWIMLAIPVLTMNPIVASAIFMIIFAIATSYLIYICIVYKNKKVKKETKQDKLIKRIDEILGLVVLITYMLISFTTFAWHITWLIWIVYILVMKIIKLIFTLKGDYNEGE